MSGCRDLLFHVHEQRFTLPEVESMIARLGEVSRLRASGQRRDAQRYLERFPEDPSGARLWQRRFEQEFPDTFSRMYQFWVA